MHDIDIRRRQIVRFQPLDDVDYRFPAVHTQETRGVHRSAKLLGRHAVLHTDKHTVFDFKRTRNAFGRILAVVIGQRASVEGDKRIGVAHDIQVAADNCDTAVTVGIAELFDIRAEIDGDLAAFSVCGEIHTSLCFPIL